jgi:hypothetical protein
MTRYSARTLIGQPTLANWGKAAAAGGIGVVDGYGVATGGASTSPTVDGQAYTLLTFTSDDNLVVSTAGLFDVLLVGGGGAGGGPEGGYAGSGGGGGGGVNSPTNLQTLYIAAGTYAVDVGAGGAGSTTIRGSVGQESKIGSIISIAGGGGGGISDGQTNKQASNGSSGGGQTKNVAADTGLSVTPLYGNNGGINTSGGSATSAGAGGGGAGAVGGNASTNNGGAGGNGLDISGFITGATYYAGAGGAGGGAGSGGAAGNGGVTGKTSGAGNNGVNYGAGGGGTNGASAGGNGAAGAVYVRFKV